MKIDWKEIIKEKNNPKTIAIAIIVAILLLAIITTVIIYCVNTEIREWIDKNILRKEVMQDKVTAIELKESENPIVYAFNKYIGVLNRNKFIIYGNNGSKEKELEMEVSNPVFNSSNRFLVMAEKKGKKLYLITDKEITWEANVEGNISQVHVNKNGYVAVVMTDTNYKTVINMYNPQGTRIFKTYLSSTRTADITISNDNKYLAIAEIDTSGTIIQSNLKIISIEKASTDPTNSIEKTYKSEPGKLIANIKYQDKSKLICMYADRINMIENEQDNTLTSNDNKKVIFQSIELNNHAIEIQEKSSGLFTADSVVSIIDTNTKNSKEYMGILLL